MTFLPAESITVGLYALALSIITVLVVGSVPGGLGTISGSKFGLGISALNVVEFETAKGPAKGGKRLLFFRKVTEWGSPYWSWIVPIYTLACFDLNALRYIDS